MIFILSFYSFLCNSSIFGKKTKQTHFIGLFDEVRKEFIKQWYFSKIKMFEGLITN